MLAIALYRRNSGCVGIFANSQRSATQNCLVYACDAKAAVCRVKRNATEPFDFRKSFDNFMRGKPLTLICRDLPFNDSISNVLLARLKCVSLLLRR